MSHGPHDSLTDDVIQAYVHWREECRRVSLAFRRWSARPAGEGPVAFTAYVAALDREERAAADYARLYENHARVYANGTARRGARARWVREWLGGAV